MLSKKPYECIVVLSLPHLASTDVCCLCDFNRSISVQFPLYCFYFQNYGVFMCIYVLYNEKPNQNIFANPNSKRLSSRYESSSKGSESSGHESSTTPGWGFMRAPQAFPRPNLNICHRSLGAFPLWPPTHSCRRAPGPALFACKRPTGSGSNCVVSSTFEDHDANSVFCSSTLSWWSTSKARKPWETLAALRNLVSA